MEPKLVTPRWLRIGIHDVLAETVTVMTYPVQANTVSRKSVAQVVAVSLRSVRTLAVAGMMLPLVLATPALAQSLGYADPSQNFWSDRQALPSPEVSEDEGDGSAVLPERLQRKVVSFESREAPGTIVIDTGNTALYYVLGQGRAIRYGVGVGRDGFTWSGVQTVSRKAAWPDWIPPAEMIARQPYLPRFVAGGPGNPLGAAAMYLGSSTYRIHGTNDPSTIGKFVSSGCIRLTNEDVQDLFSRVSVGTRVVVLPKSARLEASRSNGHAVTSARARASSAQPVMQRVKLSGLY
jgi:lipoprotein-anchoring transpeptidase ErfK/SrfK